MYSPNSSALGIVTDFKLKRPLMLESDVTVDEALLVMRKTHVRSVIVIDKNEQFLGLLTLADLESRKVLSLANSMRVSRSDLAIRELMTPKDKLSGISYMALADARIGDVLKTLQHRGVPHMLLTHMAQIRLIKNN